MKFRASLGVVGIASVLVACSTPSQAALPTATPPPAPVAATDDAERSVPDRLRRLSFEYWEAFNAYDSNRVLAFLEEHYRRQREEEIRRDIGRLKLFRVKLELSEESPPQITAEDRAEMFLTMKEPLGTRRIRMAFRKIGGEWKVTHSEEVK